VTDPVVEALIREREHYERRNLPDRAAAVTEVLERLGHKDTATAEVPEATVLEARPETTTPPRPKARQPRSKPT
jgi:hypothetical protein